MSRLLSLIHKRFFTTSYSTSAPKLSSDSSPPNSSSSSSLTLEFLTDSCGLPLQSALSVCKKFQIHPNKLHNSQSVLQLLKAHHFSDSHIAKLIKKLPEVLHSRVESTLKPKFDIFIRNGFVGKLLPDFIAANPNILWRDLDSRIKPRFEFLKLILGCNENIVAVIIRAPMLLSFGCKDTMQGNVDFLRKEGLPFDGVAKLLRLHPTAMAYKYDKVISVLNALKNFGIKPEDTMFVHAFGVMMTVNGSRWKERTDMMKSLGWTEEEILIVFKRFPAIVKYSDKKIRITMDFFMSTIKLEHNIIITYPYFLGFSLDKRIRPRYNIIKVLHSKKLIEQVKANICSWLVISEKRFFENYVSRYVDEVPDLLELYGGSGKEEKIDI